MSTTVYTYNDRLVGVGNDQILGTSQGGGASYTAGDYISIDNDEISVTGISAGNGTLSIIQNVTGAPLNIIYPTDVAPVSAFYDLNTQYDDALSNRTGPSTYYYVFKSPGYDNDTWSANTGDVIQLKVKESIQGLDRIIGFYASNSSPASSSAPTINYPNSSPLVVGTGAAYTVEPGIYTTLLGANPAGSSYGKYITLMVATGSSGIYVDDILNKIEFTIGGPNSTLGVDVNLDRYYLGGNIVGTKPTNIGLPAQIWLNPETKKQEVYLPQSIPSSWRIYGNTFFDYNTTPISINGGTLDNFIAYKYDSATGKLVYARMTCSIYDTTNNIKKSEFVTLEPVSGKFEKWTYDYSNSSDRHWTTETIETGGGSTYTAGDYISIENDEIAVTGVGNLVAGNNITITESGNNITISSEGGGSTYTAGQYISIDSNDVIAVTGLAPVSGSDGIAVDNNVVSLDTPVEIVAGENITISVTGASAIFSAQTVGVTEAQVYDATVTAVQAATGEIPTFTEGNCIDITSNAISWETTAGITDIVSVTALPANPVATVIYLIPET